MIMDRNQADAIARAILEPDLEAQEQLRRKRAVEAHAAVEQRRRAWFGLGGFAVGAVVGYVGFGQVSTFGLAGGGVGVLLGWVTGRGAA